MTLSSPARPDAGAVPRRFDARCAIGLACLLTALAPVPVSAVGIGAITQQSALGQSLRVVVPVTLGEGEAVASECFRIAAAQQDADGIPQLLFGRVNVERSSAGTNLVISNPRPVNDPVVRLTIQAGCESAAVRREYTLFMDLPAVGVPVVVAEAASREAAVAPRPAPAAREQRRPVRPAVRSSTRAASAAGTGEGTEASRKAAPPKGRATAKAAPKRPPAVAADQPRLSLSSGAPGTVTGRGATTADREKAQQEQAAAIETETQVLRQRIVELTALVERMQQEVRAQEIAERAAAEAAKATPQQSATTTPSEPAKTAPEAATAALEPAKAAPEPATAALEPAKTATAKTQKTSPPVPARDWWDDNAALIAAIVLLPLLIAVGLLWKRRRVAAEDDQWRLGRTAAPRADRAPQAPQSVLRNPTAGLVTPRSPSTSTISGKESDRGPPDDIAVDALAVSELSHVTEEARVFAALGHNDRAIEVLHEHIRRLPRSMPAAWLMLLDLYHATGNRPEFRRLAEDFHVHFNVQTPLWEAFAPEEPGLGGLDGFPHVEATVVELWRKPGCRAYLERLLYDNREGRRNGFPLSTYADILLLVQVLDAPEDVDIDRDLASVGKLGPAPAAPSAPRVRPSATAAPVRTRRPMPPDPAASRPAQQPIRFDIEPPVTKSKPKA
ncbi:MAG: hypothetical protein ABWZ29_02135 [Casimicrobiaceae bacterium]